MALTDIYQLTALGTYQAKPANNVWHVERLGTGFSATDVNQAFNDHVRADQLALQQPGLEITELKTFNLGVPTDFENLPLTGAIGTRAGTRAAQFVAFAFRFPTTNRDIRSGRKRFGGAAEDIATGEDIAAAFITDMNTLGASIIDPWETAAAPGVDVCRYVVLKRVKVVDPVTGAVTYRLPETDAELKFFAPVASISQNTLRTQNTRKALTT